MPFGINFRSGQYNLSKKNSRLLRIYLLDNTVIDWPLSNRATGNECIQHIERKCLIYFTVLCISIATCFVFAFLKSILYSYKPLLENLRCMSQTDFWKTHPCNFYEYQPSFLQNRVVAQTVFFGQLIQSLILNMWA